MLGKVRKFAEEWHMLEREDRIIIGVSGGADSICLLFVLSEFSKEMGFDIVAVHVNHGLRGEDADRDEAYVKGICSKLAIPCVCYFENIELIAKNRKQSTEEAGRDVRRRLLEKTLQEYHGTKIALAHHKNDNVETFLMNLARGTGLKGLGGIYPSQGNIIRPLLCVERMEIEDYLAKQKILFCTDKTNASDDYTRNRVRNHIIPYMVKEINERAVSHIDETMAYLRQVQAFMEEETAKYRRTCVKDKSCGFLICREEFEKIPATIKPLMIKKVLSDVARKEKDLESAHIKCVAELFDKQVGRKVDLPYQMEARRDYEGVLILKKTEKFPDANQDDREVIFRPQQMVYYLDNYKVTCRIVDKKEIEGKCVENSSTKWFDYDIIQGSISFRLRRPGDYITIHKDGRTQKLKSYFINEKIPNDRRDSILLVAEGNHVLWVAGYRKGSAYRVSEHTKHILEIKIDEGENYGRDN